MLVGRRYFKLEVVVVWVSDPDFIALSRVEVEIDWVMSTWSASSSGPVAP